MFFAVIVSDGVMVDVTVTVTDGAGVLDGVGVCGTGVIVGVDEGVGVELLLTVGVEVGGVGGVGDGVAVGAIITRAHVSVMCDCPVFCENCNSNACGPAVSAVSLYFLPTSVNSGTLAVSGLLLSLGGLWTIWRRGKGQGGFKKP